MEVLIDRVYRHYKGDLYLVEGIARHSETCEPMVVYRALYGDCSLWVRPLSMFTEPIDNKSQAHRFELCPVESVRRGK